MPIKPVAMCCATLAITFGMCLASSGCGRDVGLPYILPAAAVPSPITGLQTIVDSCDSMAVAILLCVHVPVTQGHTSCHASPTA
jgi:hypothetical protein